MTSKKSSSKKAASSRSGGSKDDTGLDQRTAGRAAFLVLALVFAAPAAVWYRPMAGWVLSLILLAVFVVLAGYAVTRRWNGFGIGRKGRLSLSQSQTLFWTVLVLSAYLGAVATNVRTEAAEALAVGVPESLWGILGISAASLVGSPLLLRGRADRAMQRGEADGEQEINDLRLDAQGRIDPGQARWSDLIENEGAGNKERPVLDATRVQMVFFTVVVWLAYAYELGRLFYDAGAGAGAGSIESLPEISGGMLALLGISHAGYLGGKNLSNK